MSGMNHKNRYIIIMAGGKGERFWPVSRQAAPKQLITLLGGRSFLQQAVDRVRALAPLGNILIITNAVQAAAVRKQLPEIPRENIIGEPCGRDTCAAVTLGAALAAARNPDAVLAVLPADHVIPEEVRFQHILSDALDLAAQREVIVTIGIKPAEPATGYGYIQIGAPLDAGPARFHTAFFHARRFVEKPAHEKAVEYLASGEYRWNAGMFVWSCQTFTRGLAAHQPEMAAACERWRKTLTPRAINKVLAAEYPAIKKISIDFALMEKAANVVVADGAFAWDDLGAWTALARHLAPDAQGNCAVADLVQVDSERNIIFDARKKNRTPVALVGVREMVIVQTDDALLVADLKQAQKIKELVAKLAADPKYKQLV
jgi:mannose-1-phosphate guanylyltransferase